MANSIHPVRLLHSSSKILSQFQSLDLALVMTSLWVPATRLNPSSTRARVTLRIVLSVDLAERGGEGVGRPGPKT